MFLDGSQQLISQKDTTCSRESSFNVLSVPDEAQFLLLNDLPDYNKVSRITFPLVSGVVVFNNLPFGIYPRCYHYFADYLLNMHIIKVWVVIEVTTNAETIELTSGKFRVTELFHDADSAGKKIAFSPISLQDMVCVKSIDSSEKFCINDADFSAGVDYLTSNTINGVLYSMHVLHSENIQQPFQGTIRTRLNFYSGHTPQHASFFLICFKEIATGGLCKMEPVKTKLSVSYPSLDVNLPDGVSGLYIQISKANADIYGATSDSIGWSNAYFNVQHVDMIQLKTNSFMTFDLPFDDTFSFQIYSGVSETTTTPRVEE